jgi:muconolactone delta-isomerase
MENKMRILAIEVEKMKGRIEKSLLEEEAIRVYELYKKGKIREIYFNKQDHTAIILFEVKDIHEAGNVIKTLPLVKSKYIDFKLMELIPYSGYDRIFKQPA